MAAQRLGMARLASALLLLAILPNQIHSQMTAEEERLVNWVLEEGGTLKVTLGRRPDGVRGLFTTQAVAKGDMLVHIPDHIVLSVKNVAAAEAAPTLLKELHVPCSRLRPYLDVLPKEDEVLTGYNFPQEYTKFLADPHLEELVAQSFKRHARATLQGQNNEGMDLTIPEAVGRMNISLPYWEYVVSTLTSRTFSLRKGALALVPVLDMANHDPADINQLDNTKPDGVRLMAGADLAAGQEVTISYGNLRSDDLLLYYGFLDTQTQPPRLLAVDHPRFKPYESEDLTDDPLLAGSPQEIDGEMARLRAVQVAVEERLEALGPVPDHNPYVAGLMRGLHEQRRHAIRHELERLQVLMEAAAAIDM